MTRGEPITRRPVVGETWESTTSGARWKIIGIAFRCYCGQGEPHNALVDDQLGPENPVCPDYVAMVARPGE